MAPRLITEQQVRELLTLDAAIDVLADAYASVGRDRAASMPRAHLRSGERILHAVGGALQDAGIVGTKTWLYTPNGASPLLVLFSLQDGALIGLVEAFALGQLRTAATSGLGTRLLARPDARRRALLGTGKQTLAQAAAVCAVREIDHIQLFAREASRRASLAAALTDTLSVPVSEHGDVGEAVAGPTSRPR
jgi:alanine dehydrogenase